MWNEKFPLVIAAATVTYLIRVLPFVLFSRKKAGAALDYYGSVLPFAVMAMLVVFCIKDVNADNAVATLLASLCVIALQVYQRNTLLSITGGTALYMILLRMLG